MVAKQPAEAPAPPPPARPVWELDAQLPGDAAHATYGLKSITTASWIRIPVHDRIFLDCFGKKASKQLLVQVAGERPSNPLIVRFEHDGVIAEEARLTTTTDADGNIVIKQSVFDLLAKHDGDIMRVAALDIQSQPRSAAWDLTGFRDQLEKFKAECRIK
jgi:hypothetical protein